MLSDQLYALFRALDIKQAEFADRVGFSQPYISLILTNKRPAPSDRFFDSAQRAFSVNPVWLRTGEGDMFLPATRELSDLDRELIVKYHTLPLASRRVIDEVVDAMVLKSSRDRNKG